MMTIMMLIHGQPLPIIGRLILPIMMTILVNTPFVHAQPFKTMINIDISSPLQTRVKVIPSREFPGGTHYTIKNSSMSTHVIGMVRDDDEVLVDGDATAMSRYILVQNRQDGMRYIRVITRWRMDGRYRTHIDEFIKGPLYVFYSPVARTPVNVDIPTQDIGPYINVELLGNWEEHDRRPGVMPEDIEEMPLKYTIQPEMALHAMIGVVRYGHHILENGVDGLMSREVIWEGGVDRPTITITSQYTSGEWVKCEHIFSLTENGFIHGTRKWQMNVCG